MCLHFLLLLLLLLGISFTTEGDASDVDDKLDADSDNLGGFWCPENCRCSHSAKIIDCSGRELTQIPTVGSSTTRLYVTVKIIIILHLQHSIIM